MKRILPEQRMHGMGAAPSPWQPPPDSDVGTFATLSVDIVTERREHSDFDVKDKCGFDLRLTC